MFGNFFFPKNRVVYEIMSKNMVEPERPQMTIWRRVACWSSKATCGQIHARACVPTHTQTHAHVLIHTRARTYREICNIYCFSTATILFEGALLLLNKYIACLDYMVGLLYTILQTRQTEERTMVSYSG